MESRADRRTSHALHTVTTHDHASDRPGYFIGELRLNRGFFLSDGCDRSIAEVAGEVARQP